MNNDNNIKKHYIYTIKNEFFEDFPDPQLKSKGDNRPNYYVFQGKEKKVNRIYFFKKKERIL